MDEPTPIPEAPRHKNHQTYHLARFVQALVMAVILIGAQFFIFNQKKSASSPPQANQTAASSLENSAATSSLWRVIKVVDGDTIDVERDGHKETVRFIGINTPETVDPRKTVECFGKEASAHTKELLTNADLRLDADPSQDDRDKYHRLLRYVYLDGALINQQLIADGFAYEYTYKTPYLFQTEFKLAQAEAKNSGRGLWSQETCGGKKDSRRG